ncbi:hypothetical protein AB0C71_37960 [Streptomyces anulatus]
MTPAPPPAIEADKVGDELVTSGPVPRSNVSPDGFCTAAAAHHVERI